MTATPSYNLQFLARSDSQTLQDLRLLCFKIYQVFDDTNYCFQFQDLCGAVNDFVKTRDLDKLVQSLPSPNSYVYQDLVHTAHYPTNPQLRSTYYTEADVFLLQAFLNLPQP